MNKLYYVAGVLFLTGVGTVIYATTKPMPVQKDYTNKRVVSKPVPPIQEPPSIPPQGSSDLTYACEQNTDCIKVQADACGCTAGGNSTAINKAFEKSWITAFPQVMCPQVISEDPTCSSTSVPKCVNNRCELVNK
ncbi:MAG: hypothetical protein R3B92_04500 [Patescibacteria group bacterium]